MEKKLFSVLMCMTIRSTYMMTTPKVMPPIYFYRNYKQHNNSIA